MNENKKQYEWILDGIDCANCASKVERGVAKVAGVANSNVNYMTQTLSFEVTGEREDQILSQVKQKVNTLEPDVVLKNKADGTLIAMSTKTAESESAAAEAVERDNREDGEENELRTAIFCLVLGAWFFLHAGRDLPATGRMDVFCHVRNCLPDRRL